MRKKQSENSLDLQSIKPLTTNQHCVFEEYNKDKNLLLHGMAGTGKTFCALYLALKEIFNSKINKHKVYIVRSAVPTRDVGFLPGSLKEKMKQYEAPYRSICTELFNRGDAYEILKTKDYIEFMSTSFVRGSTYNNCVLIVDEIQNLTYHELDSIITQAGDDTRLVFSGDFRQSDLTREQDRTGLLEFIKVLDIMPSVSSIEFGIEDVVRSGLVKEYLLAKHKLFT